MPEKPEAYWYCVNKNFEAWSRNKYIFGEAIRNNIYDIKEAILYLKKCDYVIYQNNADITREKILEYSLGKPKLISMSSVYLDNIDGMIERENKNNVDIRVSKIALKHQNKKLSIVDEDYKGNHITTFLSLEILKEICNKANMKFYNKTQYQNLLKFQYPNYN